MAFFTALGALVPLDHFGHYFHWHFIYLSLSNLIIILLMIATFLAAILAPFPGRKSRKEHQ